MTLIDSRFKISGHVQHTTVADEVILLDTRQGTYLGLDEIGTRLWHQLAEDGHARGLVEVLHREFDAPSPVIRQDIEQLLQTLAAAGLIEICGEA